MPENVLSRIPGHFIAEALPDTSLKRSMLIPQRGLTEEPRTSPSWRRLFRFGQQPRQNALGLTLIETANPHMALTRTHVSAANSLTTLDFLSTLGRRGGVKDAFHREKKPWSIVRDSAFRAVRRKRVQQSGGLGPSSGHTARSDSSHLRSHEVRAEFLLPSSAQLFRQFWY